MVKADEIQDDSVGIVLKMISPRTSENNAKNERMAKMHGNNCSSVPDRITSPTLNYLRYHQHSGCRTTFGTKLI